MMGPQKRTFYVTSLNGRCANGAERDSGVRAHAVESAKSCKPLFEKALCRAEPGRRSAGWSYYLSAAVTCPRCLKKLEQLTDFKLETAQ